MKDLLKNIDVRSPEFLDALLQRLEKTGLYYQNTQGLLSDDFLVQLDKKICIQQFKRLEFMLLFIRNNPKTVENFNKTKIVISNVKSNMQSSFIVCTFNIDNSASGQSFDVEFEESSYSFKLKMKGFIVAWDKEGKSSYDSINFRYNKVFEINGLFSDLSTFQYYLIEDGIILQFYCRKEEGYNSSCHTQCKLCKLIKQK